MASLRPTSPSDVPKRRRDPRNVRAKVLAFGVAFLFLAGGLYTVVDALVSPRVTAESLALASQPQIGSAGAPVSLVLFESPACEACREFHVGEDFDRVLTELVLSGRARLHYVHAAVGDRSWEREAAIAQECLHRQSSGAFWVFTVVLYRDLHTVDDPVEIAESVAEDEGLAVSVLRACMGAAGAAASVDKDMADARRLGVKNPPAVYAVDARGHLIPAAAPTFEAIRDAVARVES